MISEGQSNKLSHSRVLPQFPLRHDNIQLAHRQRKSISRLELDSVKILARRSSDVKSAHNVRRHSPHLHNGEVVPNALVRACAERHEGPLVLNPLGLVLFEPPLGHELRGVLEVSLVALDSVNGHPDQGIPWDVLVAYGDALGWSLALDARWDCWMEAKRFVDVAVEKR